MTASGHHGNPQGKQLAHLCLLALGVVYGDIGTSPLYAMRECFHGPHAVDVAPQNVLGVLSLILWSLMVIISLKYLTFVLRADNRGEGGVLSLMALLTPRSVGLGRRAQAVAITLGLFGAALLYGDGMITPAISVLSAIEGLKVATPIFEPYVIPITIAVLIGVFSIQRHGTGVIGVLFGPIMIAWFATLAVLGVVSLVQEPGVLRAVSPHYAIIFLLDNGLKGYLVLGAVFLVVTGGEALYADMGHLGPKPIRVNWFTFVLPALLLNYFGQGALLMRQPAAIHNPFYNLVPEWGVVPLVVLATIATVIASQAVISGVFSLTVQAVQLGFLPRMRIEHTSERQIGQTFVPPVNSMLMLATVGLVLGFQESSSLAAAYGVSVNLDMIITTALLGALAHRVWHWKLPIVLGLCGALMVIELLFLGANAFKIPHGGWFPLVTAAGLYTIAVTWKRGRLIVGARIRSGLIPLQDFVDNMAKYPPHRVEGTAVFLNGNADSVPMAMAHNLKHNKVLHKRVVFLTIMNHEVPRILPADRVEIKDLGEGFYQVIAHYGFSEEPHVPLLLEACASKGLKFEIHDTTFFLGRESLTSTSRPGMTRWRERLFATLARNAQTATAYFHIPPNRVIEVGAQIEM